MSEVRIADVVNDSIDRLNAGRRIVDIVAAYPQYGAELETLLETGRLASRSQPGAAEAAQARMRGQLRFEQALNQPWAAPRSYTFSPLVRLAASIVLVFAFLAGGAGILAENSLPGDTLYEVKLFTETLRLTLAGDDPAVEAAFDARRFDEARALLQLQREATMTLRGEVEAMTDDGLLIGGLIVQTGEVGDLAGNTVEIDVISTAQGELIARDIRPQQAPINTPPLTETATSIPSDTAQPTETVVPSATATLLPTRTSVATPTSTDRPTREVPTLTPTVVQADRTGDCQEPPAGWVRYTIQGGDTLSELAVRSGSSVDQVAATNCIEDTRRIIVGQTILLPRRPAAPPATDEVIRESSAPAREATPTPEVQREREQQQDRQRATPSSDFGGDSGRTRTR